MHIIIEQSELARILGHVASVIERRTTLPILSCVLIEARERGFLVRGTDLEREVTETGICQVETPGRVAVSAQTLHDIVRRLPDGADVSLKLDQSNDRLAIRAGKSRFALPTLPPDDYPSLSGGELPVKFELPAAELAALFEKVRFAISTEETRYYLNGIFLHVAATEGNDRRLRAVATDGHRLGQCDMPLPAGAEGLSGVIIPRKTVGELQKLLDTDATVRVAVSPAKIEFTIGSVVFVSKLIDGSFPDYARVIPRGNSRVMRVHKADFAASVDRVSTVATEKGRAVKLEPSSGKLALSFSSPEGSTAQDEIAAEYAGEAMAIGFNGRYLLDMVSEIDGPEIEFLLGDPGSPALVRDTADEASRCLFVLMPMRV